MEFFRLSVFGLILGLSIVFLVLMHKYSDVPGSSIFFGNFAGVLSLILGSMILLGFKVIVTEINFVFNLNTDIALMCYALAIYSFWFSIVIYKLYKPKYNDFEVD